MPDCKIEVTEKKPNQPPVPQRTFPSVTGALVKQQPFARMNLPQANSRPANERSQYEYHLGQLDLFSVAAWERSEPGTTAGEYRNSADFRQPVNTDGDTYFSYIRAMRVAGSPKYQIREPLRSGWATDSKGPQLDERVAAFRRQWVRVTSDIEKGQDGAASCSAPQDQESQ